MPGPRRRSERSPEDENDGLELRWEFANITAAVVFLFLAFAAIALFCFRLEKRDPTPIYFALFCLLYGVRVLAYIPFFRSLFNESPSSWNYLALVISNYLEHTLSPRHAIPLPSR